MWGCLSGCVNYVFREKSLFPDIFPVLIVIPGRFPERNSHFGITKTKFCGFLMLVKVSIQRDLTHFCPKGGLREFWKLSHLKVKFGF